MHTTTLVSEFAQTFRDAGDRGDERKKATPLSSVIEANI